MMKLFQAHSAEQKLTTAFYWAGRINLGWFLGFLFALVSIYFLLLGPEHTFLSLDFWLVHMAHLNHLLQLMVISLMPIYLSVLIFGGSLSGAIVGSYLWEKAKTFVQQMFT